MENVVETMPVNTVYYVEHMNQRMKAAFAIVRDSLNCAFGRAKRRYDARVKAVQLKVGDLVWYYCPRRRPRLSSKWQLLTTGRG